VKNHAASVFSMESWKEHVPLIWYLAIWLLLNILED